jgi:hypothetical protein
VGGLAAGYYATAPGSLGERERAREQRAYEERLAEEFSEMEAAAAFLAAEERRLEAAQAARPASTGL